MKVPKLQVGDRVKALLDMDAGQVRAFLLVVQMLFNPVPAAILDLQGR